jgi:excisionase family DNA binding protein
MVAEKLMNNMLTLEEVSQLLYIHPNTLRRWSDSGKIKSYRIAARGDRRFKLEDIAQFLEGIKTTEFNG